MSSFVSITAQIVSLLQGVQQGGAPAFATVADYPTTLFDTGTPAATVAPADNTSEYATVIQNLRTYSFDIDIYYPIEAASQGAQKSFQVMRVLVDTVLDALDNSNDLNNSCDFVRPVPSNWSLTQSSSGELLTARIVVQCAVTVDTDN